VSAEQWNWQRSVYATADFHEPGQWEAEYPWGASTLGWRNTTSSLKDAVKVGGALTQCTADPEDRLARLVSTPEFFALRACNGRVTS
jgi:hypothetical protein